MKNSSREKEIKRKNMIISEYEKKISELKCEIQIITAKIRKNEHYRKLCDSSVECDKLEAFYFFTEDVKKYISVRRVKALLESNNMPTNEFDDFCYMTQNIRIMYKVYGKEHEPKNNTLKYDCITYADMAIRYSIMPLEKELEMLTKELEDFMEGRIELFTHKEKILKKSGNVIKEVGKAVGGAVVYTGASAVKKSIESLIYK